MCETEGNIAIGIVGMSSSGKSTLARKIFFSSRVEQLFELMLWVDLSNAMGLEKKYECISVEKDNVEKIYCGFDLCTLLTKPFSYSPRKCLVVLDGVWHAIEGLDTSIQAILDGHVNGCRRRPFQEAHEILTFKQRSKLTRIQEMVKLSLMVTN
ncbi:putative late blight resistance proteinR1A-10 [Abeliophyllum distichum]|uniref:Late blight resistance proteinR1A-10 n=1 Tax=Abeliophyllum distichum TaxID=126358 RepID=A0ABD1QB63_9LAMI